MVCAGSLVVVEKRSVRILAAFIVLSLVSRLVFRWWKTRARERLTENGRVVSTALGPVECSIRGEGPAVLLVPGCPGGYDQALLAGELLGTPRLRLLAISRPGYLGTPLGLHHTPEAQADVFAALLDELQIRRAAVVGISGGGPSALQFALRYPNRCYALATVAAISQRMTRAQMNHCKSLVRRIVGAVFLAVSLLGGRLIRFPDRLNKSQPSSFYAGLLRSFLLMQYHRVGLENDMTQLIALPNYSLHEIRVPTLVMHGTRDSMVPYSHAEFLARQIPDVTEIPIPSGGHLFLAEQREQLIPKVIEFIEKHTHEPGLNHELGAGA